MWPSTGSSTDHQTHGTRPTPRGAVAEAPAALMPPPATAFPSPLDLEGILYGCRVAVKGRL